MTIDTSQDFFEAPSKCYSDLMTELQTIDGSSFHMGILMCKLGEALRKMDAGDQEIELPLEGAEYPKTAHGYLMQGLLIIVENLSSKTESEKLDKEELVKAFKKYHKEYNQVIHAFAETVESSSECCGDNCCVIL